MSEDGAWRIVRRRRWRCGRATGRELERLTRASSVRAGLAQRARIVLLAADGVGNTEIAERVGVARQTVLTWRARYRDRGLAGLEDIAQAR